MPRAATSVADQHVDVAGAERLERLLAGALAEVAVHGADLEAALGQLVGDLLRGALGAGEDHRRAAAVGLQHAGDHLDLVQRVRAVDELLGGVVGGRGVRRLGPDVRRLVHERAGQRDDRARHGRREQHRLPLGGDLPQDALDVGQEAQVEHLVGLVEHQHRQPAELQVALLGRSSSRPGVPTTTSTPALQRLDLRLVGPAAVDGRRPTAGGRPGGQVFGARWPGHRTTCRHSSRVGTTTSARGVPVSGRVGVGGDALQQRHAEGEGLAHAGAGLADQVVAGQRERQGQFLDGEGMLDAFVGERADDFVADAEFGKGGVGCSVLVRCRSYVGDEPFGDVFGLVSVILCRGHARTSSDSEYVAESPAPSRSERGCGPRRASCARTFRQVAAVDGMTSHYLRCMIAGRQLAPSFGRTPAD